MTKFKDATGAVKTTADYGATWLSDKAAVALGLEKVADDYEQAPTADEVKKRKMDGLLAEYNADVQELKNRVSAAMLESGTQAAKVSAAQSEFATRKAKYAADRKALLNS